MRTLFTPYRHGTLLQNPIQSNSIIVNILLFIVRININYATANQTMFNIYANITLPRNDNQIGVAYWNNTIYLFGGNPDGKQLITINSENQLTDHGKNVLTTTHRSSPNSNSQIYNSIYSNIVYYIEYSKADKIVIYDLANMSEIGYIYAPQNIDETTCVTSDNNNILYFFGGIYPGDPANTSQAYNITNQSWFSSVPNMQTGRRFHSCVFDPVQQQIWVMGGFGTGLSVEKIFTHEIITQTWQYSKNLIVSAYGMSSIYYKGYILLMGGYNSGGNINTVQLINCYTEDVFLAGSLNYKVRFSSPALIGDIVYLFGGLSDNGRVTTIQYSVLAMNDGPSQNLSKSTNVCPTTEFGFINTTYKLTIPHVLCHQNDTKLFLMNLIFLLTTIIDSTYQDRGLFVHSNISQSLPTSCGSGNISVNIITCFGTTTLKVMLSVTNSKHFERDINDKINDNNGTIKYIVVYITNITTSSDIPPEQPPEQPPGKPPNKPPDDTNDMPIILIPLISIICALFLCIVITCIVILYKKKKRELETQKSQIIISNAMVILIAVGIYDENPTEPDPVLSEFYLQNLQVEKDIQNLRRLFGSNNLNYSIYPTQLKLHWTKDEILELLTEKAEEFDKSNEFDALIVVTSGHGIINNICTSDYKLISKLKLHRLFSVGYYNSREKPRIFIYDSCDGSNQAETPQISSTSSDDNKDCDKGVDEIKVEEKHVIWPSDKRNPDYKLVQLSAANPGFQSKLNNLFGSYMLHSFVEKEINNLNTNNKKYLYEIFDEIQAELEMQKKQHIVTIYNDQTRFVRFMKNISKSVNEISVEMIMKDQ